MKEFRKYLLAVLSAAALFSTSGCRKKTPVPSPVPTVEPAPAETEEPVTTPEVTQEPVSTPEATEEPVSTPEASISEDDIYDTKDEVALYIYTFHHLPSCYMTKKEARKKGWEGGALNRTIKGMCIGGDYFGNYEGLLPETGEDYYECDIDTMYKKSRGSKRIIYTLSGDVWYTGDHYESYTQLYDGDE
jgi:hypothetical protein